MWGRKRSAEYGGDWARIRLAIIRRDAALCQPCRALGRITPNCREVDHIVPVSRGGTAHPSNLQTICRACHARKTRREQSSARPVYGSGIDGLPVDPSHPWAHSDKNDDAVAELAMDWRD